jgi:hypothetical protein
MKLPIKKFQEMEALLSRLEPTGSPQDQVLLMLLERLEECEAAAQVYLLSANNWNIPRVKNAQLVFAACILHR